ncbi:hypothetical protein [Thermoleptolyngbya sp.]
MTQPSHALCHPCATDEAAFETNLLARPRNASAEVQMPPARLPLRKGHDTQCDRPLHGLRNGRPTEDETPLRGRSPQKQPIFRLPPFEKREPESSIL